MENENSGQNETQPARKKRRKADAPEVNEAAAAGSAEGQEGAGGLTESRQSAPAAAPLALQGADEAGAVQPLAGLGEAGEGGDSAGQTGAAESGAAEQVGADETGEAVEEEEAEEPDDRMPDGLPVRQVVEALLFATDSPLPAGKIAQILERGTSRHVRRLIGELNEVYEREGRAFRIEEVAGGYQMLTVPALQPWLGKLLRARQESRLSPTQMETLAVVAYKQPVLRAAVEVVRGVACGDVINRLREMGLVKIVGRAEDVGRPLLYGTTKKFLRVFGLGSLEDLPRAEELRPPEGAEAAPGMGATTSEPAAGEETGTGDAGTR